MNSFTLSYAKFLYLKPRRVAATTVAQRVAIEMNVQLGQEVYLRSLYPVVYYFSDTISLIS